MSDSCRTVSKGPKAAVLNQEAALVNIRTKISIMEKWITAGVPVVIESSEPQIAASVENRELDFYPTSLRQFNFWESSKQCTAVMATLPPFGRNANDTLRKYPLLRNQVVSLLKELAKCTKRQSNTGEQTASALRRQLAVAEARKRVVEAQFSEQRRQIRDLKQAMKKLDDQMIASVDEAVRINILLQAEVATLRSEKAELAKALINVKPFHSVAQI